MPVLDSSIVQAARAKGKLIEHKEELHYWRFREGFRSIPRGTVLLRDRIIYGFPHIPRIFTLEKGIEKNIAGPFFIEEKIDGFNLRVARINDAIYAFSRGGFLDRFATEKVRDRKFAALFSKHPNYVLCGEMIGNTPYTPPTAAFDIQLFVFDIDRGDGTYLPGNEKYSLLKRYGLASVPVYGRFTSAASASRLALRLLKAQKEGIVIKSLDRSRVVKFVTPFADIEDIHKNIGYLFDMPSGFFLQRVLRSAIFLKDFRLSHTTYADRIGRAFYDGLFRALRQLETDGTLNEEFEIRIRDPSIWSTIAAHTGREVKLKKINEWRKNGYTYIRFQKIYKRTSKKLRDFLRGKALID